MKNVLKHCKSCGRDFVKESDFLEMTSRWRLCEDGHLWFNCKCHSTLVIMKGKFDWYSPDLMMKGQAKSLFNQLPDLGKLPHIPTSVMKLQQKIQDENSSSIELARLAKKDPLIATRILQVSNNLRGGGQSKIESLAHAISYMGVNTLNDIVLAASIKGMSFKTAKFDSDEFWFQSFLTGKIVEMLAKEFNEGVLADEAYLAGTLCNLGKVVGAICFPEKSDQIAKRMENPETVGPWAQIERATGAYDHGILGEIGSCFWGLPEYIMEVNREHHSPVRKNKKKPDLLELVQLGNQLSHWVLLRPNRIDEDQLGHLLPVFQLSERRLEELAGEFRKLVNGDHISA